MTPVRGGMPPLGFDTVPEGGKIVVNRDEADQVRAIFDLYLEHGSLLSVVQELNRRGWRRKSWTTKDGKIREGKAWDKTNLVGVLRNPLYAGLQKLGDETFRGEHDAIVPKKTWDRVQRLLDANRRSAGAAQRNTHGALLRVYRATRDLFLAQRFARHVSPLTTVVYTHPSDEEMAARVRKLAC